MQTGRKGRFGAETALAVAVVLVVGMLVVPVPTYVLDVLLVANIGAALVTLLAVLSTRDAASFGSFPSLLLVGTLARVALTVSSTRLVLTQADAGAVIRAFGTFVVRGDYVVGAVIFVLLSIVQLLVVARGAERVAEVAARFTLDALPGRQMSIDAEVRAGTIDAAEATRRRAALERQSQFHGAMDGAMKFVKGDVVASLLILSINVIAGVAIGVVSKGLSVDDALRKYTLLTIGEGLVTQIPALVMATAAGLLMTRVSGDESSLGRDLARDLLRSRRPLVVAAVVLLALGVAPGLPAAPFVVLAGALGVAAYWMGRDRDHDDQRTVATWAIELGGGLAADREELTAEATRAASETAASLGLSLPPPRVSLVDDTDDKGVTVLVRGVPAASATVDDAASVAELVSRTLRERASELLSLDDVAKLLAELGKSSPAAVRQTVPDPLSLPLLLQVLRRLLAEGVGIRDLALVLESLALQKDQDPAELAEHARAALHRQTTYHLLGGASELPVMTVERLVEDEIRRATVRSAGTTVLAIAPGLARDVVSAVERAAQAARTAEGREVPLLVAPDIRRFMREIVALDLPLLEVVSPRDLAPDVRLRVVATAKPGPLARARQRRSGGTVRPSSSAPVLDAALRNGARLHQHLLRLALQQRVDLLREEDREVLRVVRRELLQRATDLLHVVQRGRDEGARAPQLRAELRVRLVVGVVQVERLHPLLRLTRAPPRLGHDRRHHRARLGVLVARQVDAVDELAREIHLAAREVDQRALEPRLVGLGGQRLAQVDPLELRERLVRVVLHEELRPRERRGQIALLELLIELLDGGLTRGLVGDLGGAEDVGDGARLRQPPVRPADEPGRGERDGASDRVADPVIDERGDEPPREQGETDAEPEALQDVIGLRDHRLGRRRRGALLRRLLGHGRDLARPRRPG